MTQRWRIGALAALMLVAAWGAWADPPGAAVTTVPTPAPGQALAMTQSAAVENSHVFKTAAGNLYSFGAVNTNLAGFILLIDGTTVPGDGALASCGLTNPAGCLKWCGPVALGTASAPSYTGFQLSPGPPMPFVNGVVAVYSSTGCGTKTIGAANIFFEGQVY